MTPHINAEDWLEPSEGTRLHVANCSPCMDLATDLDLVRGFARDLEPDSWGGGPPVRVDVEAALFTVLSEADTRTHLRRASRTKALRLTSSFAAALMLFSLGAPFVLRLRIETPPTAQLPQLESSEGSSIFWTTWGSGR